MPRLRDHPDDLYALVSAASEAMHIPVEFVEKDFWVTELLRSVVSEATAAGAVAVFKGGTSLSKAYRMGAALLKGRRGSVVEWVGWVVGLASAAVPAGV